MNYLGWIVVLSMHELCQSAPKGSCANSINTPSQNKVQADQGQSESESESKQLGEQLLELRRGQRLGEEVSDHVSGGLIHKLEVSTLNTFANEVVSDVNVLGALFGEGVLAESNAALVVFEDGSRRKIMPKFAEERA